MTLHSILTKLFGSPEEINGNQCPSYLFRWTILKLLGRGLYLHHFVGSDWARDLHDHPRLFVSIGLWGSYYEIYQDSNGQESNRFFYAPWIRWFPATHKHRIICTKSCWTLVYVGKITRHWGFWHNSTFVYWRDYVFGPLGKERKDC